MAAGPGLRAYPNKGLPSTLLCRHMREFEFVSTHCRSPGVEFIVNAEVPNTAGKKTSLNEPLKVLIIEDSENDATLLEIELQRAGYDASSQRVETRAEMLSALATRAWDLI